MVTQTQPQPLAGGLQGGQPVLQGFGALAGAQAPASHLLDVPTLAALCNEPTLAEQYPAPYLGAVLATVDAQVASYLRFCPWLAVHQNEEGLATWIESGPYAGRYLLALRHRPLVPGPASAIFSSLQLTYALATTVPTQVSMEFTTVNPAWGRAYCLAPGSTEALAGLTFGWGPATTVGTAVGYIATYAAGWSALNDPTTSGGGTFGADPLPADIQQAAALLARERIAIENAQNAETGNPQAGVLVAQKIGQRSATYRPSSTAPLSAGSAPLGYGTPLSEAARAILDKYRRTPTIQLT